MTVFPLSNSKLFDKLLDKATSPLLLETDWESILQLCDVVKTQEVAPKYTVQAIKKKLRHENPHVILNSLQCMESIVKNCGGSIHQEIAQKDVMDVLKELVRNGPDQIRSKTLDIIQCWSHGLGEQYKIFTDTYNLMKFEKYRFPPLKESEAMFENDDIAPKWRDDKHCFRCRQSFNAFTRKHHCRACGDIFCDKCSSKSCPVPKFSIDRDVRVCELCYEKLTTRVPLTSKPVSLISKPVSTIAPGQRKNQAKMDDDDASFRLALAISQSEADEKERQKKIVTQKYAMPTPVPVPTTNLPETNNNEHVELDKYTEPGHKTQETNQNGHEETTAQEQTDRFINEQAIDQFTTAAIDHIDNFKFRMLSNQQRNRNITTDTAVQSIFVTLQYLHPELHRFLQLLDDKRTCYETLQDKLTQLKDAREALNALRTEHYDRKQQEAFERDRQRQLQLAYKLDFMREKKQEYLAYQRQVHLQHFAQQELEMKTRLEQQRQFALSREQHLQNSHLSTVSYDYNQMSYPQSSIDSSSQYPTLVSFPSPQFQYRPTMMQPPTIETHLVSRTPPPLPTQLYLINSNRDNNYTNPAGAIRLTDSTVPHTHHHEQLPLMINTNKPDPQLMIFD